MKCSFAKLEGGEYWVTVQHGMLQVMYQLVVRGKVATKAVEEIIRSQGIDPVLVPQPINPLVDEVEDVLHWVEMKHGLGGVVSRSTLEVIISKLQKVVDHGRGINVEGN